MGRRRYDIHRLDHGQLAQEKGLSELWVRGDDWVVVWLSTSSAGGGRIIYGHHQQGRVSVLNDYPMH